MGSMALGIIGVIIFMFSTMSPEHRKEWIRQGLIALAFALVIRWSVGEPYRIPSASMETTLHGDDRIGRGDRVFVNKWVYGVRYPFTNKRIWNGADPQRWDIVVFKTVEEGATHTTLVKRIVGMPGERIHIENGNVYVNGEALEIPDFMPEDMYYTSPNRLYSDFKYGLLPEDEFSLIPQGHYLVLGDNSSHSRDGRVFGWLPNEHIMGRVSAIWWPPPRWRDFTGFTQSWWWKTLLTILGVYIFLRMFIARSWSLPPEKGKRELHYLILFIVFGLRIPMTQNWLSHWGTPKRGDLVLYAPTSPHAEPGAMTLGRIIGLPGEKIFIEDNGFFINEAPIDLPGLDAAQFVSTNPEATFGRGKSKKNTVIPENSYFILSEFPEHPQAVDSRLLGWVTQKNILGKAVCIWWPLSR
jgi:signal peptidase I